MSPILLGLRGLVNKLGVAWWAKVETNTPTVTYWFGPFLTKKSLNNNLDIFMDELAVEGYEKIGHSFFRGRRREPLTI